MKAITGLSFLGAAAAQYAQTQQAPSGYQQPAYQQPAYQPPSGYQQPAYQPPSGYQQPAYQQPAYQPPSGYQQPPSGYQQPPSGYQQPPYQQYPNQPPANYRPAYTRPGELEYNQFWNNAQFCQAELSLIQCVLDCETIKDFVLTDRIAGCIEGFVKNLCGSLKVDGCKSNSLKIAKDTCAADAVTAAMFSIRTIQDTKTNRDTLYDRNDPDKFNSIKTRISMRAVVNYGNCVGDSYYSFINQCNMKSILNPKTSACVEGFLNKCGSEEYARVTGDNIGQLLFPDESSIENLIDLAEESDQDTVVDAIDKATNEYRGAKVFNHRLEVDVDLTGRKGKNIASVEVCPNNFLPINYRIPALPAGGQKLFDNVDIPGFPKDYLSFHFASNQTYGEPANDYQFRKGTAYDPVTPKGGLGDICTAFYGVSAAAYTLGVDSGDWCFSIDKYSIEFLESGESRDLDFEETGSNNKDTCRRKNRIKNLLTNYPTTDSEGWRDKAMSYYANYIETYPYGSIENGKFCPKCYRASWEATKSCPRHLSRWRMHVRCCKSYKNAISEYAKATPNYVVPVKEQSKCSPPSKDMKLEYSHIVYSDKDAGNLQRPRSRRAYRTDDEAIKKKIDTIVAITNANLDPAEYLVMMGAIKILGVVSVPPKVTMELVTAIFQSKPQHFLSNLALYDPFLNKLAASKRLNPLVNVDINWNNVVQLTSDKCAPTACLLARYIDCCENPSQAVKQFVPPPKYVYGPEPYQYQTSSFSTSYRALLASAPSKRYIPLIPILAFGGGAVVVALAQFVLKRTGNAVTSTHYNQLV